MRILALGDVIAPVSVTHLCDRLPSFKKAQNIDLAIINAENASFLAGIESPDALRLLAAGADVLTGGNHSLQNRGAHPLLEQEPRALRPINYPSEVPGYGSVIVRASDNSRVLVINAMGTAFIEPVLDNPYPYVERALSRAHGDYDIAVLDFHAEATGEKLALAHYFDGQFSAIWGTHTHVPTADTQILPQGTGYVSDLGATAPTGGILGVRTDVICERFRRKIPAPYKPAEGPVRSEGVIFDIDTHTRRCRSVTRITI